MRMNRWSDMECDTWDQPEHHEKESVVNNIGYYACQVGLDIVDEEVETADGYLLR